jgi:RimJ/RimL family protein N-acetyltransferase
VADAEPVLLTTDRLVIRRLRPTDAATVAGYKNDPDIARHQEWPLPYPVETVMVDIAADAAQPWPCPGEGMNVAIEHAGDVVGDLYVAWDVDGGTATIGYTLASAHHGNGYATEAVAALVDLLFADGITKVRASVDPANAASIGVLRRVGFRLESTGRVVVRGEWVDDATYTLTPGLRADTPS